MEVSNLEKRLEEIDEAYEICENTLKDTLNKLAECNRRRANEFGRCIFFFTQRKKLIAQLADTAKLWVLVLHGFYCTHLGAELLLDKSVQKLWN